MEEEFYSLVKLVSGEEVIAKVSTCDEDDRTILILENPVIIKDIVTTKLGIRAYRVEPWIKVVEDDVFFIDLEKVITMSEIMDKDTIQMYRRYLKDKLKDDGTSRIKPSKSMGYISSVQEFKSILEKLYKDS
jgi:hypothetical protein